MRQVPLPELTNQIHQRDDGEMTGGLSGAGPAHAISDDHRVAELVEAGGDRLVGQGSSEAFPDVGPAAAPDSDPR